MDIQPYIYTSIAAWITNPYRGKSEHNRMITSINSLVIKILFKKKKAFGCIYQAMFGDRADKDKYNPKVIIIEK